MISTSKCHASTWATLTTNTTNGQGIERVYPRRHWGAYSPYSSLIIPACTTTVTNSRSFSQIFRTFQVDFCVFSGFGLNLRTLFHHCTISYLLANVYPCTPTVANSRSFSQANRSFQVDLKLYATTLPGRAGLPIGGAIVKYFSNSSFCTQTPAQLCRLLHVVEKRDGASYPTQ